MDAWLIKVSGYSSVSGLVFEINANISHALIGSDVFPLRSLLCKCSAENVHGVGACEHI